MDDNFRIDNKYGLSYNCRMNRQDKITALLERGVSADRISKCHSVDDLYDCIVANDRFAKQIELYGDRVFDDSPEFRDSTKFRL